MQSFDYYEVKTLREAVEILSSGEEIRVLAGGCGILLLMKQKVYFPQALVNIKKIPGLNYIRSENGEVRIGTLSTLNEVKTSYIIQEKIPILSEALEYVATDRIRNMATMGGTLAHADPNSDVAPALLALEAKVKVLGRDGEKEIPLDSFFQNYYETTLQSTDVIKEIILPAPSSGIQGTYARFQVRKAMDKPMPGVAVLVGLEEDGKTIRLARIALSGVGNTPIRLKEAEEFLKGKEDHPEAQEKMASMVKEKIDPVTEYHYSVEYKREMAGIFIKRAFAEAYRRTISLGRKRS
jgi:carbon-monoxide dehydrogenase medium subunit